MSFIGNVAVRLVDGKTGNSCVGITFMALLESENSKSSNKRREGLNKDKEDRGRHFMLVEDELSRNPEKLLKRLRSRKIACSFGRAFKLENLKTLLNEAPILIVMPEVGIDPEFWSPQALRKIVEKKRTAVRRRSFTDLEEPF
jgi:hypothetical protein